MRYRGLIEVKRQQGFRVGLVRDLFMAPAFNIISVAIWHVDS
jgi:hypothetical protein